MLKWIFFPLLFLLCIFGIFAAYLYTYRAPFVAGVLTRALGTQVTIGELDISKTGIKAVKVRLANPSGSLFKNAFSAQDIEVQIAPKELIRGIAGYSKDPIVIDSITIYHPAVSVELFNALGSDNNWRRLIDKLPPATPGGGGARTYIIKKIVLTDIAIAAKNRVLGNLTIRVPEIPELIITPSANGKAQTAEEVLKSVLIAIALDIGKQMQLGQFAEELQQYYTQTR